MKNIHPKIKKMPPFGWFLLFILFILMVGLACNTPTGQDTSGTQAALDLQATQLALKETQLAQDANQQQQDQQPAEDQPEDEGPDLQATLAAQQATQAAMELEATLQAQQLTLTAQASGDQPQDAQPEAPQESQPEQPTTNLPDFDTWMSSASILLFEDMASDFSVYRFIQLALDGMNVSYTDVRDALGHYKNQILSAGPGGQGWDLIISGKEQRTGVQGEFYVYLNDALNIGSSVIIEEWDMDSISGGTLSSILNRCGVRFQEDWFDETLDEQLLFAVDGTNPIHHYPNEGISLTNPNGFWNWTDLGDKMMLSPGSQAKPLWVARSGVKDRHLVAVSCMDGRLIIQTYGTHSYGQDRVVMMWQNYIYNALKARYDYLLNK